MQTRLALFYCASALSGAFSGLLAFAIAKMDGVGGRPGWAWIFLLEGIATGNQPAPSFEDGFRCQAVLDAVERSAASGGWEKPVDVPV